MPENENVIKKTVIVKVFHSRYSVLYGTEDSITENSVKKRYNNGNEFSRWDDSQWDRIIHNLQIDKERDLCRFIVFSDIPVECPTGFLEAGWTWDSISDARSVCSLHAGKWFLNGIELPVSGYFPVEKGCDIVHISTFPEVSVRAKHENDKAESDLYRCFQRKSMGN